MVRIILMNPPLSIFSGVALFAVCVIQSFTPLPEPEAPVTTNPPVIVDVTFLPLEILGPDATAKTIEIGVTNGSLADELSITAFNLQYEGMASIRINGGTWVDLTESTVGYDRPMDAAMWGIGGVHGTLHMNMAMTNWTPVNGTNTLEARFNDGNGLTIGWRLLRFNFRHAGTNLIAESQFTYDDPATWTGPSTNMVNILDGQDAWYNLAITEQGTNLVAHCTDCHDRTGRDLTYFNYSNESIIQRSIFHQVPAARATNIASYIRWLRAAYPVPYETNGRPWNPPYQPGPGMTFVPVRSWAAGAGLDWVLTNDLASFPYIFGTNNPGTNWTSSYTNTLDAREIPLAVQFPTWNMWLPRRHPLDTYNAYYSQTNNNYFQTYRNTTNAMNSLTGLDAATYFNGRKSIWDSYSASGGVPKPGPTATNYYLWFTNLVANKHWRNVKTWEIMTEFAIEEYGTNVFGALSDNRRWFHGETFNLAPHKTQIPQWEAWAAQSMQWYQAQLVLNSGNRNNRAIVPLDWGYQHALNKSAWVNSTNEITYSILVLNCIKGIEVSINENGMTATSGWQPFKGDPQNMASINPQASKYLLIPLTNRVAAANAVIKPWMLQMQTYTRAEYGAADVLVGNTFLGNRMYAMTANFITTGVDATLTAQMYHFGTNIWPEINWSGVHP